MNRKAIKIIGCLLCLSLVFILALESQAASDFPKKLITIYCPYSAGGATDLAIRMIANEATEVLGSPVIVMNKAGGGGYIANAATYKAKPDGYTLVATASSSFALKPHFKAPPYDPWKLTPIMSCGLYALLMSVGKDVPYKDFGEMLDYMKKNPGKVKFATGGGLYMMECLPMYMLKEKEKIDFKLVPYKGGAPGAAAVMGGHCDGLLSAGSGIQYVKSGELRPMVVFTPERLAALPDTPTLKELGYEDIVFTSLLSIYGPPDLPQDIAQKLSETFRKAMDSKGYKRVAKNFNINRSFYDAKQTDEFNRDLTERIHKILTKIGAIK